MIFICILAFFVFVFVIDRRICILFYVAIYNFKEIFLQKDKFQKLNRLIHKQGVMYIFMQSLFFKVTHCQTLKCTFTSKWFYNQFVYRLGGITKENEYFFKCCCFFFYSAVSPNAPLSSHYIFYL